MLNNELIKKIEDFVYSKPRSIQEIAKHIAKNWRTADRYINEINKNFGTISTRVFREGTRGALKIVYWSAVDKISSSVFQEKLEEEILRARRKEDFSAFDIFQYIKEKNKSVRMQTEREEEKNGFNNVSSILNSAQKQLLIFSGNLSFANMQESNKKIIDVFDSLVKRGISIKILCRVDIAGRENVESILALNFKHGKEMIEIKHREHPLRAIIIDNSYFDMKEVKEPTGKMHELNKKLFIFYKIKDREWTDWLTKIFWKMFSSSIDAKKRLQEMQKLR